jgi:hypothetical protein
MNYIPLEDYNKAWIFRHRDLPISDEEMLQIKPLTEKRAEQIWSEHISRESSHPEHFGDGDWAAKDSNWLEKDFWHSACDSNSSDMPLILIDHIGQWDDNITVYFCYQSDHIIETKWGVFRRHWKNFLFFDNGPVLLGRKRKEVAQFFDNGSYRIGLRG